MVMEDQLPETFDLEDTEMSLKQAGFQVWLDRVRSTLDCDGVHHKLYKSLVWNKWLAEIAEREGK